MAEFCLECFNKVFKKNYIESEVGLSWSKSLCEGCSEYKRVVTNVCPKIYCRTNKDESTGLQKFLSEIKRISSGYYKRKQ